MNSIFATPRQRVLYEAREIWRKGFVAYDTETTGLEQEDQVIQWAVCSQDGEILGSGFVKPTVPISAGAFKKHGISIEQLADAPTFAEVWPAIRDLLAGKVVVIYHASFDIGKLWSSAHAHNIDIPYNFIKDVCAMHLFARFYDEVHEYFGTYTWQKLNEVAIPFLNIQVPGRAHDAEHDAAATAMLIKRLAEIADQELPPGWHPPVLVPCAGCGQVVRECAEASDIWYCQICGLEKAVFHRCPACNHVVEVPATGAFNDDLCAYCQQQAYQQKMVLSGAWHRCPDSPHHIVQTPDREEPCANCKRQREWKRKMEEESRLRKEQIERERKMRRSASAKAYRQRRKEREQENRRREALGLLPLEASQVKPAEEIIQYQGHQFQRRKDQYGKPEVYCLKCQATWSRLPRCFCAEVKTYRSWTAIPEHLKTRTQLLKLHLKLSKDQEAVAVIDGAFDRYRLYDKNACVPV